MRKLILAAIAAAGVAGSTFAYTAYAANEPPSAAHTQQMQEERAAMLDAHLAGFKAGLKLTADQDKLWAPFESAIRDAAKERGEAMMKMREMMDQRDGARPSPIDHMLTMSDRMAKMSSELKIVADAGKPLYDSLNDMQKRNFGPLLHDLIPRHGHGGHMGWRGHGGDGEGSGEMQ
jgi:LTXXQ motif family protein